LSRRSRICFKRMVFNNISYCRAVGVVVHELGHSVGIPGKWGNERHGGSLDTVNQFGRFGRDLCEAQTRRRGGSGLRNLLGDHRNGGIKWEKWPPSTVRDHRYTGLVVYPRKNFDGTPRHFPLGQSEINDRANLRRIGRDDAISSFKIFGGAWQVCTKLDHRKCQLFSTDQPQLRQFKLNNKISSLRYVQ